jgi:glyoxylase-like metal-dependent hydrolase (beta-lactamase superfamily II)
MLQIKSFTNTPVDSVTYLLANVENNEAIVIDPGTQDDLRLKDHLDEFQLDLRFIFLTHEHFDHILGVNFLRKSFPEVKVISSAKTSERLPNPKKNLSVFHNQMELVVEESDILVEDGLLSMIDLDFQVFSTKGHTDSSISLKNDLTFFSGDFLLKGSRIITNLPTGSKMQYQESFDTYKDMLKGVTIFPGHGDPYLFE